MLPQSWSQFGALKGWGEFRSSLRANFADNGDILGQCWGDVLPDQSPGNLIIAARKLWQCGGVVNDGIRYASPTKIDGVSSVLGNGTGDWSGGLLAKTTRKRRSCRMAAANRPGCGFADPCHQACCPCTSRADYLRRQRSFASFIFSLRYLLGAVVQSQGTFTAPARIATWYRPSGYSRCRFPPAIIACGFFFLFVPQTAIGVSGCPF